MKKGFYVYILENWCGHSCRIIRAFRHLDSARSYLLEHEDKFYRLCIRKIWVSIF